jgi:hypothetical protein
LRGLGEILEILREGKNNKRVNGTSQPIPVYRLHSPLDPDDEVDLWLAWDVEVTGGTGFSLQPDLLLLFVKVFLDVLVGSLEDDLAGVFAGLVD